MNNELKHYGVPGMKWGVKRAKKDAKTTLKESLKNAKTIDDKAKAREKYNKDIAEIEYKAKLGQLPVTNSDVRKHRTSVAVKSTIGVGLAAAGIVAAPKVIEAAKGLVALGAAGVGVILSLGEILS